MAEVKERIKNRDILCLKSSFQVLVKNIKLFKSSSKRESCLLGQQNVCIYFKTLTECRIKKRKEII